MLAIEILVVAIGVVSKVAVLALLLERLFRERARLTPIVTPAFLAMNASLFALLFIGFARGSIAAFLIYSLGYGLYVLLLIVPLGFLGLRVRKNRGWTIGPTKEVSGVQRTNRDA